MTDDIAPHTLTYEEAARLAEEARGLLNGFEDRILRLWEAQAWKILGYDSWDELCDVEFQIRVPRTRRRELVATLTEKGMTQREIAATIGVDQKTVSRDLNRTNASNSRRAELEQARKDAGRACAAAKDEAERVRNATIAEAGRLARAAVRAADVEKDRIWVEIDAQMAELDS